MNIPENVWKAAESVMARRERLRYIREGRIVPAHKMQPQMMVKDENGRWCPELVIRSN